MAPPSAPRFSLMDEACAHAEGVEGCRGYVIEVVFDQERGFWAYGISVEDGGEDDYEVWFPESFITAAS